MDNNSIKNYEVKSFLGEGQFGQVFKVQKQGTNEEYAMKIMQFAKIHNIANQGFRGSDEEEEQNYIMFLTILRREVDILKRIDNQYVCQLQDYFEDQQAMYLILDLCDGNLQDFIMENPLAKGVSEKVTLEAFLQVLRGLAYINQQHIIHRDIKPENILHKKGIFKICDFGLAVQDTNNISQAKGRTILGTPNYSAPEIQTGKYDFKVDVWSLGCVLFFMLFGEHLYNLKCGININVFIIKLFKKQPFNLNKLFDFWKSKGLNTEQYKQKQAQISQQTQAMLESMFAYNPSERPDYNKILENSAFNICDSKHLEIRNESKLMFSKIVLKTTQQAQQQQVQTEKPLTQEDIQEAQQIEKKRKLEETRKYEDYQKKQSENVSKIQIQYSNGLNYAEAIQEDPNDDTLNNSVQNGKAANTPDAQKSSISMIFQKVEVIEQDKEYVQQDNQSNIFFNVGEEGSVKTLPLNELTPATQYLNFKQQNQSMQSVISFIQLSPQIIAEPAFIDQYYKYIYYLNQYQFLNHCQRTLLVTETDLLTHLYITKFCIQKFYLIKVYELQQKLIKKENFLNIDNFDAFSSSTTYQKIQAYIENSLKSGYDSLQKIAYEVNEEMYNEDLEVHGIINNIEFLKIVSIDYKTETYKDIKNSIRLVLGFEIKQLDRKKDNIQALRAKLLLLLTIVTNETFEYDKIQVTLKTFIRDHRKIYPDKLISEKNFWKYFNAWTESAQSDRLEEQINRTIQNFFK